MKEEFLKWKEALKEFIEILEIFSKKSLNTRQEHLYDAQELLADVLSRIRVGQEVNKAELKLLREYVEGLWNA